MPDIYDLVNLVKQRISQPTTRDKQVKIGPSSLGNECALCIARIMSSRISGTPPMQQSFSLYPWLGTAVHYYLQHLLEDDDVMTELDVPIAEIKGTNGNLDYGFIKGQCDLYSEEHRAVIDYKISSVAMIRKYSRELSKQYSYQAQLYGYGVSQTIGPVDHVGVLFIPRDSPSIENIKLIPMEYDEALAESALRRASKIWNEYVVPHFDPDDNRTFLTLRSFEDCWSCRRLGTPEYTMNFKKKESNPFE